MPILEFDCPTCLQWTGKAKQRFGLNKGAELIRHSWFAQCLGCGWMCIKVVDDTRIKELDLS
jgi:hypothetical protein